MSEEQQKDPPTASPSAVAPDAGQGAAKWRKERPPRWHRFEGPTKELLFLRASSSMRSGRFKLTSRGRQGSAASVAALVYAQLVDPGGWVPACLDQVLDYGDRLYRVTRARGRYDDEAYITTGLLQPEFFVGDYKCRVCYESGVVFGNLDGNTAGAVGLVDGLRKFFECRNFGVLTAQGISVAIWNLPPHGYFYFDPGPCDEAGKRIFNGCACAVRTTDPEKIYEVFMSNMNRKYESRYCIDKVILLQVKQIARNRYECGTLVKGTANPNDLVVDTRVLKSINPPDIDDAKLDCTKPPPEKSIVAPERPARLDDDPVSRIPLKIELTNYMVEARFAAVPLIGQALKDDRFTYEEVKANVPETFSLLADDSGVAVLHGWTHEGSDAYKAKGAQSVANCVLANAVEKVQPVKSWLRTTMDEILAMGDAIYAEVKAAKPSIKAMTAADLNDAKCKIGDKKWLLDVELITVVGTVVSKTPSVLNVRQGMEEFFAKNTHGVLECSSINIAIFINQDVYFMFDSRPCDVNGNRVVDQKAGGKGGKGKGDAAQEKKVVGKSCVLRFPNFNLLYSHFSKYLDYSMNNDRFTIRRVEIVPDVPGIRDWNSFRPAMENFGWILYGSLNNEHSNFKDHSRGCQGLAIHVAALVGSRVWPMAKWTKDEVDDVVKEGDDYYNWCMPTEESEEEDKLLTLRGLKKYMYFKKCKTQIDLKETVIIGDLEAEMDSDQLNLTRGIKKFFESFSAGVVEGNEKYFAIWKIEEELKDKSKETAYYMFHPKPDENFNQRALSDASMAEVYSCVVRVLRSRDLAALLEEELQLEDEDSSNEFFVHEVKVGQPGEPMTDEEIEEDQAQPLRPELRNYAALGETGAYLAGTFNQANESLFKQRTRDIQQTLNAVVAIAMARLYEPHFWNSSVVDDILKIGDRLTEANAKHLPDFDQEDPEGGRNYLLPGEISRDFNLGINKFTVDVEEEAGTGALTELEQDLETFFSGNKSGIFRQHSVILPFWKHGNVYFAMDPRGKQTGNAAVYWFIDVKSLVEFLTNAVESPDAEFFLDGVTVENRYMPEAEKPISEADAPVDDEWYNFGKISDGTWKIECRVPMTDEMFKEENRGNQSAAICIMAIIFSKVYEPRHWTSEILDEITITGEKLHSRSAARLGENRSFHPNEILAEFFIANRRIDLTIQDCVEAGTISGRSPNIQRLSRGVENFFQRWESGCITIAGSMNFAVWIFEGVYYCFEPGISLTRLETMELLAEHVESLGEVDNDFEISSVDIVDWNKLPPWKFDPSPAVRPANLPPLNAYNKLPGRARAILRASTHQGSEIFPESFRNHQTAANCIISLGMCVIKSPITWTKKILDEILATGNNLHHESLKFTGKVCELTPKDIVRIFNIGVNVLAVDVEVIVKGIVQPPPPEPEVKGKGKKAAKKPKEKKGKTAKRVPPPPPPPMLLEEGVNKFFEKNHAGILMTGKFMVAIWRDSGVYFMYDPRSRNSEGLKDDEREAEGAACVVWFACREPFLDMLMANINDDEKYANYEIFRIILTTKPIEPLPSPAGYKANNDIFPPREEPDCPKPSVLPAELQRQQRTPLSELRVDLQSSFERVDKELSILLGEHHIGERRFAAENRGYQSSAVAMVAVVLAALHAPSTWTAELIDTSVKYGDALHTECSQLARPGPRNLSPSELLSVFVVGDVRAQVRLQRNIAAGISLEQDLLGALQLFFGNHARGILHTSTYAVAVIEHWGKFYFLDPSERNRFKKGSFEGAACLIRCESLPKLAKVILQVCGFKEPTVYTLNAVQVLDLHFFLR